MHGVYEGKFFRCGGCINLWEWGVGISLGLYQTQFREALLALSLHVGPIMAFFDLKDGQSEEAVDALLVERLKK